MWTVCSTSSAGWGSAMRRALFIGEAPDEASARMVANEVAPFGVAIPARRHVVRDGGRVLWLFAPAGRATVWQMPTRDRPRGRLVGAQATEHLGGGSSPPLPSTHTRPAPPPPRPPRHHPLSSRCCCAP